MQSFGFWRFVHHLSMLKDYHCTQEWVAIALPDSQDEHHGSDKQPRPCTEHWGYCSTKTLTRPC